MRASLLIFYLVYLLNSLVNVGAHGGNIQFYKHANFTGLVWQSSSNGGCSNIPQDKRAVVYSIRTDTCFIAYAYLNCQSWMTEKYLPGDAILSPGQLGRYYSILSLQTCTEEEGGHQLNVDITKYKESSIPADVLESYKNVCSCVNVPQYVQNMTEWSIDNHHNDLLAYYEPDCSANKWKPEYIPAGHSQFFTDMHLHKETDYLTKTTYSIQSLGPNPNSTYFQTSCNSSHVVAMQTTPTTKSTTERAMDLNAGHNCQGCELLTNEVAQLKTQFDQFKYEMLQQFRNLTAQIKLDLHQLYA